MYYVGARSADAKKGRKAERWCKKRSELGAEKNRGARSDDVKKGRSAERRCQKGPERGAIFTRGRAQCGIHGYFREYIQRKQAAAPPTRRSERRKKYAGVSRRMEFYLSGANYGFHFASAYAEI